MSNERFSTVGTNIAEKATMIWNVADLLRGPFKPHEYGLVILPMTVVKRFHDCLLPTHQAVLDTWEKVQKLAVTDGFLRRATSFIIPASSLSSVCFLIRRISRATSVIISTAFLRMCRMCWRSSSSTASSSAWWKAIRCISSSRNLAVRRAILVRIRLAP